MISQANGLGRITQALALAYGHEDFMKRNTGDTEDAHVEHYIQNVDGVLSNNRHFISDTMAEYQPNGDGTTEGQALHVIGYCHMYLATKDEQFLTAAIHAWEAYINYYYAGQPIPDTAQRYICNWLVNSKEPVLANYPIHPEKPTQGGFKCVPLVFTNGQAKIPHGAPYWGEYLDSATYAHRGHMTWDSINATVQKIQEKIDGKIDWDDIYANYQILSPEKPWLSSAWIDWATYFGSDGYTVVWSGDDAKETTFDVSWINAWTGNRIGIGEGPNDQLWSGDIIATDIAADDIGIIQLEDETINGVYLFNYATKNPVADGGYLFSRNEPWHNRPVHTPFLGSVNQLGNAADAEVWFIDACYLLWRITGEERYKKALDCCFFTAHEYTYIDSVDRFFRKSTAANTPFTDGISYSFSSPVLTGITYGRDSEGYITIKSDQASQHFLEQQSVWFRIGINSKLRVTYGGIGVSGAAVGCKVMLDVSEEKIESKTPIWYGLQLPKSFSNEPVVLDVPVTSLALMTNPGSSEDYLVADYRVASDYGGCTWEESFEENVYDGRTATVINAKFPNDDAGFIIGFWLTSAGGAKPTSIVYRADANFNLRLDDDDNWKWYWLLPATDGEWVNFPLDVDTAILSGYQPSHESDDVKPTAPVLTSTSQVNILLDGSATDKTFSYYVVNDIPPLYSLESAWTMTYRMALNCSSEAWDGVVGDCTIIDYRLDSLAYCPGTIPFSNIYEEGTEQIGAWHGMPYPGYQYPFMYTIHEDTDKYAWWLENQISFLWDSQQAYYEQIGELGPGCAAYIWNRWDNYKYGTADTWTTFHWGTGKPWAGYQCRAYNAAARTWYELVSRGQPVPEKLKEYVENWAVWLVDFSSRFGGHTPNEFPSAPKKAEWVEDDFTAHMCGLWLAGSCYALLAGSKVDGLDGLIEDCLRELSEGFTITDIPGKNINGSWSPAARVDSDNGMYFGFYTGESLRGLGLYIMYKKHGAGYDMYSECTLSNHTDASLTV